MGERERRLVAGLTLGLVVGALGPVLTAVAGHSGNRSGNEPLDVSAAAPQDVTAAARWESGGEVFTIEVHRRADAAARANSTRQEAARGESGEVVATGVECSVRFGCARKTWRGVLTPAYSDGNTLLSEPTLSYASFHGWLRAEGEQAACRFRVDWYGEGDLDRSASYEATKGEHDAAAAVTVHLARAARAAAIASCWGANADNEWERGAGRLASVLDASVAASEAARDFHPPYCRELDLC